MCNNELIEEGTNPDVKKYLLLLYSAASNTLSPFGYSPKSVYDYIRGYRHAKLLRLYLSKQANGVDSRKSD